MLIGFLRVLIAWAVSVFVFLWFHPSGSRRCVLIASRPHWRRPLWHQNAIIKHNRLSIVFYVRCKLLRLFGEYYEKVILGPIKFINFNFGSSLSVTSSSFFLLGIAYFDRLPNWLFRLISWCELHSQNSRKKTGPDWLFNKHCFELYRAGIGDQLSSDSSLGPVWNRGATRRSTERFFTGFPTHRMRKRSASQKTVSSAPVSQTQWDRFGRYGGEQEVCLAIKMFADVHEVANISS